MRDAETLIDRETDVLVAGAAWLWARRHHLVGSEG